MTNKKESTEKKVTKSNDKTNIINKKEFVHQIAKDNNLPDSKMNKIFETMLQRIGSYLSEGKSIKILGYLDFKTRPNNKKFKHPTETDKSYPAKHAVAVRVKVGKTLKNAVNNIVSTKKKTKTK